MTTTTMAKEQAPKRAERATRAAHRSGEALVFAAAISLVVGLGAIVAFPSMRPAARSAVALLFGALATVNGMLHVKHIADQGAVGSDLTGVLAAAAGAVLVGLDRDPVAPPRRGSGEPAPALDLPRPRRPARAARPPLRGRAHEHRAHRDARVPRGDRRPAQRRLPRGGVRGRGRGRALRLVPPDAQRRHILVVHGGGSDRTGSVAHAELLARHGYGVLLHDARGRGKSEGVQNSWGWGWGEDVAGALAFLKSREEVDPERIGASRRRCCSSRPARPRSPAERPTTARPATGRSTSGTCPTSATPPPSARRPRSTSSA